jgi:hypothetical protein
LDATLLAEAVQPNFMVPISKGSSACSRLVIISTLFCGRWCRCSTPLDYSAIQAVIINFIWAIGAGCFVPVSEEQNLGRGK